MRQWRCRFRTAVPGGVEASLPLVIRDMLVASLHAELPLFTILDFCLLNRLPLQVAGTVRAASTQGLDVVFYVAWTAAARLASAGAGMLFLKRSGNGWITL